MKAYLLAAAGLAIAALGSGATLAADLPSAAPMAAAPAAPVDNWSGFYAGVQMGLGVVNANLTDPQGPATFYSASVTQGIAGVYGGLNWVDNSFLLGLEGDVNAKFGSAEAAMNGPATNIGWTTHSAWDASLRARLGILPSENYLLFVTGGVAAEDFRLDNPSCPTCAVWGASNLFGGTRLGGIVGAGVEYALTSQVHVKAEYLHTFFPTDNNVFNPPPINSDKSNDAIRLGISTRF